MPSPPIDYGISGWCDLAHLRVVSKWFGARIESLWENEDGRREWRRYRGEVSVKEFVKEIDAAFRTEHPK